MITFPHWDEGRKEGRAMEREGPSRVEGESGCRCAESEALVRHPKGSIFLGYQILWPGATKMVPLRSRGRSELWFSWKAGRSLY